MPSRSPRTGSSPSSPTSRRVPYRSALPPDLELEEDPLRLRLDFHDESVILHDFAETVTRTAARLGTRRRARARPRAGPRHGAAPARGTLVGEDRHRRPRRRVARAEGLDVRLRERYEAPPRRLRLPMPDWCSSACRGASHPTCSRRRRGRSATTDVLYRCPAYNVFDTAGMHGIARVSLRPAEGARGVLRELLLGRREHRPRPVAPHPEDVGELWAELGHSASYPLDDLVPHGTVADVMRIGQ